MSDADQLNEAKKTRPHNVASRDHSHVLDMWQSGTPEYDDADSELKRLAVDNPRLYTKILNGD